MAPPKRRSQATAENHSFYGFFIIVHSPGHLEIISKSFKKHFVIRLIFQLNFDLIFDPFWDPFLGAGIQKMDPKKSKRPKKDPTKLFGFWCKSNLVNFFGDAEAETTDQQSFPRQNDGQTRILVQIELGQK